MARRTFDRSTSGTGNLIDMKTGRPIERPALPVICARIRYYRTRQGTEQKTLAKKIGVTANAISNWENGRTRPDVNILPQICEALGITLYELFNMEDPTVRYTPGEQLHLDEYRRLSDGNRYAVNVMTRTLLKIQQPDQRPAVRQKIFFSKSLAAGIADPTEFEAEGEPVFLYASRDVDRSDYVFTVSGDSMEPQFHNGDKVLVQRMQAASDLEYGEVGAFIIGNETYIKIYEEDGLHSLNPAYSPIHFCEEDKVYLIGRVVGRLSADEIAAADDAERYLSLHPDEFKQ